MYKTLITTASLLSVALLAGGCAGQSSVSFNKSVKPILDKYCSTCHTQNGEGTQASGFETSSYETVMKGTKFGPVVVPGDALSSSLYRLVAGKVDPSIKMPHGEQGLAEAEIATIENWIAQGATNN